MKNAIDALQLKCSPYTVKRRLKEQKKIPPPICKGDERKGIGHQTTMNMRLAMVS